MTHTLLRLNAGNETRVMADDLPLFDIKCGGMSGRTVADGERIAADIVARYNALEGLSPDAVADVVAALEQLTYGCGDYSHMDNVEIAGEATKYPGGRIEAEITARTALARIRGEG